MLGQDLLAAGAVMGGETHQVSFAEKIFPTDADEWDFAVANVAADGAGVGSKDASGFF